jgi:pimeloyl-ACP methyl ester carboxylesterase
MTGHRHYHSFKRILVTAALGCLALTLSGCGYVNFAAYKAHWGITFKGIPSMSALNNFAPEDSLIVHGQLIYPRERQEPLLLVAVNHQYQKNELVALVQIQKNTVNYMAFLPTGDYELLVFADLDKSVDFESDEVVGRVSISVNPEHAIAGTVVYGPPIALDFDHPGKVDFEVGEKIQSTNYVYSSLDDKFFDPKYGVIGLYNPTELMYHNQGFIFGLEEYDPSKTTVLFVHGVAGTPRDWKFYAAGLDRSRFQPFFFYYPSGLQLDKLGTVLAQILNYIGNDPTKRSSIVLVAHSMGGLVAWSAIEKASENGLPSYLKMYSSFSTPYGGNDIAQQWGDKAPVKVPAWHDVATQSEFLQALSKRPFPNKLPFYLYFSYKAESALTQRENSDGVITLRSQLEPFAQKSATRLVGINETHVGILQSETGRDSFLRFLDIVMRPQSEGSEVRQ